MTNQRIDFLSPLSTIPGFGEKRIAALRANDINTVGDLLYTLPLRHIDRSRVVPIGSLHDYLGEHVAVIGTIDKVRVEQGNKRKLRVMVKDDTGSFECLWFAGITHFQHQLTPGKRLLFSGKVNCAASLSTTSLFIIKPAFLFTAFEKCLCHIPFQEKVVVCFHEMNGL